MSELSVTNKHKLDGGLKFEGFLIAFGESASRARKIINVLSIMSIAALLGLLNSFKKEWNWFPSRQERIREFYQIARFEGDKVDTIKLKSDVAIKVVRNDFERQEFQKILIENSKGSIKIQNLQGARLYPWIHFKLPEFLLTHCVLDSNKVEAQKDILISAYKMAFITSVATRDELDRTIQTMIRAKLENGTFVKIPILGIAFDVNWLIIASGMGFCAIYLLLYYSLSRERKNIKLLFQIATIENISIARLYQFMSMQQVFTIPQSIDEYLDNDDVNNNVTEKWTNKFKRLIPKLNLFLPFIIWLGIFCYDLDTNEIGQIVNSWLTNVQVITSILFGLIILFMSILCIRESNKIDSQWNFRSDEIKKSEQDRLITQVVSAENSSNDRFQK